MSVPPGTLDPQTTRPGMVRAARLAVTVVFALNGLAMASWFSRVPAARDALELTPGRLGLLLLAGSAGAVAALPVAGVLTQRLGPARSVAAGTVLVTVGLVVVGLGVDVVPSVALLAVGQFALGYGSGTTDVAMNVEAAAVERRLRRTVMPHFHAAWSIGTVVGAALGAGAARLGLPVGVHLALMACVILGGTLAGTRAFLPGRPPTPGGQSSHARRAMLAWREPRTLLIGLFVLVMAFTEGTANDWIAVGFVDGRHVDPATGAAVFGIFLTGMTTGRILGTRALDRWGRVRVLAVTTLVAAGGAALAVLAGSVLLGLAGVVLWGVGASLGFPVGMSAAADDEDRAPARVSVVAVIGYTAFLAGPPFVGLLGDRVGTLRALLVVPVVLVPALALLPVLRPPAPVAATWDSGTADPETADT